LQLLLINVFFTGVLGIKVKIMLPWDTNGKIGPKKPLPDNVTVQEPKEEFFSPGPMSETKPVKDLPAPPLVSVP
jgi:small subunit ribosomal protein S3e